MTVTKRYSVPKFWGVKTKANKYVVSPKPGPHNKEMCVPLSVMLRDMLGHARTMKEAKNILGKGIVKINGIPRKEKGFPVGLMDVVDVGGDFYRVLPAKNGLRLFSTDAADAATRLAKIKNKVHLKKKKLQLNLHDGSNILVDKDDFKTLDIVVIDISHKTIKDSLKFEKGSMAIVTDGHNSGVKGTIESIDKKLRTVMMTAGDKKMLVPMKYIFVVGRGKPVVNIGE